MDGTVGVSRTVQMVALRLPGRVVIARVPDCEERPLTGSVLWTGPIAEATPHGRRNPDGGLAVTGTLANDSTYAHHEAFFVRTDALRIPSGAVSPQVLTKRGYAVYQSACQEILSWQV